MNWKKNLAIFGLAAATSVFATQYEAEDATLAGGAVKSTDGTYVSQKEGSITWNVNVETAGKYKLAIHYKAGDKKINYIEVNGSRAAEVTFDAATRFSDVATTVSLKAGANTIAITHFWGWIDVDYITLEAASNEPFTICNAPVTPNATPSAVKLYNFLTNNFQKKTISGVMTGNMDAFSGTDVTTHEDVQAVYKAGGKYPALVGFDFMNTTGLSATQGWFKTYAGKIVTMAEDLWKKGGIPAFTWHWNDPNDDVMAFYANQEAAGYEDAEKTKPKPYTTFDFTKGFVTSTTTWDTTSTTYKNIISDMDEIADVFLGLQEKGVAAIFRPLHESGGDWFWWSTHTGKQFAALYRLLYERLVFTKGVKNLVWDFNPQNASMTSWNPGEDHYDVLSVDIYNPANDHSSNSGAFDDLKLKFGKTKLLALSENGPIPDIAKMKEDQAVWSWWMPWYQSWSGGYVSQTANSVWQSNLSNDAVITLDKMPGWESYNEANSGTQSCPVATAVSTYGKGTGSSETTANMAMEVSFTKIGADAALINKTGLPDLTKSKSISVDLDVRGDFSVFGPEEGVWIGLAIVKDGSEDEAWTWEMSNSTGCWFGSASKKTCEFDITTYTDDAGVDHDTDLDKPFSVVFMISGTGFTGSVIFDNVVTDNEKVISTFDSKKGLFAVSEGSEDIIKSIELVDPTNPDAIGIRTVGTAAASKLSVSGNSILFNAAKPGMTSVEVFGMNGKRVATLYRGMLSAGTHAFDMSELSKGQYIIRVKGVGFSATQPIRR